MVETRIVLSGLWVATMLTYLLGDALRLFAGDFVPGKIQGVEATPAMWLLIAVIMLLPIIMVVLSLIVSLPAIRWLTIAVAAFLILFNLIGLPYDGAYDNFLIIVSIVFNIVTVWYAWQWA